MKTFLRSLPPRRKFLHGQDTLTIGYPWLTYGAILALEELLTPTMRVLELGSGGSTLFFARRVASVVSFETNETWYAQTLAAVSWHRNVSLALESFERLPEAIAALPDGFFDLALVDHADPHRRKRMMNRLPAALCAAQKVAPGGWLAIDNYATHGMQRFPYENWDVFTYDDMRFSGRGTRLCRKGAL
jgi:predicted O-methyltransferase YrrM